MIELATRIEPIPVKDTFPEGLEDDNKQPDENNDTVSEQEQTDTKDRYNHHTLYGL